MHSFFSIGVPVTELPPRQSAAEPIRQPSARKQYQACLDSQEQRWLWWRPNLLGMLGSLCVLGVGGAAVADAAEPMPCAPSISASCRHRLDQVPIMTQVHQWHTLSSVAGVLCAVLGMLLLCRAFAATRRARWARASWAAGLAVATLSSVEIPLTFTQYGVGAVERVHVVLISAWIAAMGWYLYMRATSRFRR